MSSYTTPIIEGRLKEKSPKWILVSRFYIALAQHQPLSPNIHIQILHTYHHTFPHRISRENLLKKDQNFGNYYINPHKLLHFDIVRLKIIDVTPLLSGLLLNSSIFIKWLLMFLPQQLPLFDGGMTILLFTV